MFGQQCPGLIKKPISFFQWNISDAVKHVNLYLPTNDMFSAKPGLYKLELARQNHISKRKVPNKAKPTHSAS